MLKKITMTLFIILTILIFNSLETSAQNRIRFAKGSNSATVSGPISYNAFKEFVVRGRAGQTLIVVVSSSNGKVVIANNYRHRYTRRLGEDGDYSFQITNMSSATRYRITVRIIW